MHVVKLVKWRRVATARQCHVTQRLCALQNRPPTAVPTLFRYGWTASGKLRLEVKYVEGRMLSDVASGLSPAERQDLGARIAEIVNNWPTHGFIHGDLSPSNILIGRSIWFVDWILDLKGFEATPAYASKAVYRGKRGFESDQFALNQVLNACRLR